MYNPEIPQKHVIALRAWDVDRLQGPKKSQPGLVWVRSKILSPEHTLVDSLNSSSIAQTILKSCLCVWHSAGAPAGTKARSRRGLRQSLGGFCRKLPEECSTGGLHDLHDEDSKMLCITFC